MHADLVESLVSVQRRKVDIRRLVDIYIVVRSAKHAVSQSDGQDRDVTGRHTCPSFIDSELFAFARPPHLENRYGIDDVVRVSTIIGSLREGPAHLSRPRLEREPLICNREAL